MAEDIDRTLLKMKACGCRKDIIDLYEKFNEKGNKCGAIQSFQKYKKELQREMDDECKSIACIDYLIYELEKNK